MVARFAQGLNQPQLIVAADPRRPQVEMTVDLAFLQKRSAHIESKAPEGMLSESMVDFAGAAN